MERISQSLERVFFTILLAVVFFGLPIKVAAAELHFDANTMNATINQTMRVRVLADTYQSMNSAAVTIKFPTKALRFVNVDKSNSLFTLWVEEPNYSEVNSIGTIRFQGVKLNPGFTGVNGELLAINFLPLKAGSPVISFETAQVLANDGIGTDISSPSKSITIKVSAFSFAQFLNYLRARLTAILFGVLIMIIVVLVWRRKIHKDRV